jgi:hypothetical protein
MFHRFCVINFLFILSLEKSDKWKITRTIMDGTAPLQQQAAESAADSQKVAGSTSQSNADKTGTIETQFDKSNTQLSILSAGNHRGKSGANYTIYEKSVESIYIPASRVSSEGHENKTLGIIAPPPYIARVNGTTIYDKVIAKVSHVALGKGGAHEPTHHNQVHIQSTAVSEPVAGNVNRNVPSGVQKEGKLEKETPDVVANPNTEGIQNEIFPEVNKGSPPMNSYNEENGRKKEPGKEDEVEQKTDMAHTSINRKNSFGSFGNSNPDINYYGNVIDGEEDIVDKIGAQTLPRLTSPGEKDQLESGGRKTDEQSGAGWIENSVVEPGNQAVGEKEVGITGGTMGGGDRGFTAAPSDKETKAPSQSVKISLESFLQRLRHTFGLDHIKDSRNNSNQFMYLSQWGNWNPCNATCESDGERRRSRICLNPTGRDCQRMTSQKKACKKKDCSEGMSVYRNVAYFIYFTHRLMRNPLN